MSLLEFTAEQQEIIVGVMLGDGYMCKSGERSASFQLEQAIQHKEWVEQLKTELGLETCKTETRYKTATNRTEGNKTLCYRFRKANPVFHSIWKSFYIPKKEFKEKFGFLSTKNKSQVKIVPNDIELTSTVLYHWYMGDGTLLSANRPAFCAQGFPKAEIDEKLVPQFEKLGIKVEVKHDSSGGYEEGVNGYMIAVKPESGPDFFKMIGPCRTEGFEHKWRK